MSKVKTSTQSKTTRRRTTTKPKVKPAESGAKPKPTSQAKPKVKPKLKKDNTMRNVFIAKVVVNMSLGVGGETLDKARTVLEKLTGQKPTNVLAKSANRDFGLRKGEPMGCKVTLQRKRATDFVKRALDAKDYQIPVSSVDHAGNVSFGISEHIQIPGVRYDPDLGIFGMDICICTERAGFRINRRRRGRHRIPRRHQINREEAIEILSKELGVKFTKPELEEE
jgi:large subunit ribosomal protein L5